MSEREPTDADLALVRGVRNCGRHHEENETAPAIRFAESCRFCAGEVFRVVWNAAQRNVLDNLRQQGYR